MNVQRSVLIVTPFFAPQSHAAVFRAYKLAKFLPKLGWKVFVVTVDRNYHFLEDPALLQALPAEVTVKTADYIEPTLRGIRMGVGGKDRTFHAMSANVPANSLSPAVGPSTINRTYNYLLQRWIHVPDAYWTWKKTALREAGKLIRENGIQYVITSSSPYTTLEIGMELKKQYGVKWVADIRDPLTYEFRMHSSHERVFAKQRCIERAALQSADAVTFLTSAGPMIITDSYGSDFADKLHFIPTGLDDEFLPGPKKAVSEPYILFAGEYLAAYGGEIFDIFKRAIQDPRLTTRNLKFRIIGRTDVNRRTAGPHVERLGLESSVEFQDNVPQRELYGMIQNAEAAVLCTSLNYGWWIGFAKLVDYLALQKRVLARVPDPSEARKWLTQSRLGVFLDGDVSVAATIMADALSTGMDKHAAPDSEVCRRFLASAQAEAFSNLLASLG